MLAPEPFFEPRGTPFSEYHRIEVLGELGYEVDLVTYPFGRDVSMSHLRILRSARPPFITGVRIGPSMVKVLLDLLLAVTAFRRALMVSYDAIHSHEEAGVLGAVLSEILGIPHLYDMHSSLPQQLQNFQYTKSPLMRGLFERAERKMIDSARVVITICQELQDSVVAVGAGDRAFLIENVMGGDMTRAKRTSQSPNLCEGTTGLGPINRSFFTLERLKNIRGLIYSRQRRLVWREGVRTRECWLLVVSLHK